MTTPLVYIAFIILAVVYQVSSQKPFNPAILQDSRDLPKVDGRFGFLYRTEDGIAHAARGEPGGQVRGRFTYTDPTGLKVNFNYNAGSKTASGYNYNEPLSTYEQKNYAQKQSGPRNQPTRYAEEEYDDGSYREEPQQYEYDQRSRSRPSSSRSNTINSY